MKIWLGTTTRKFSEYKNYYFAIRNHLVDLGCVLTDDWIGKWGKWIEENPTGQRDIKKIVGKIIKAINTADVSIIEFTVPNFSSSHQINYSIFKKKPTLVMRLHKDNTYSDSYIEALDSPHLFIKDYTINNYKDIIDEFIGYSKLEAGLHRYNIVLDRKHKHFLDWVSTKNSKSRSEIIRDALESEMEKNLEYKNYLKH